MRRRSPLPRASRGTTLLEAMVAMAVLLIGLAGFISLQVVAVRANEFNRRMTQATAMANDLAEAVKLWNYTDTRLAASSTVTTLEPNATIAGAWDLGKDDATAYTAQYSEDPAEPASNATNPGALAPHTGLTGDVDGDGDLEFIRLWNVYDLDANSDGVANGKLVQIIVRWREAGHGFRQVTSMAFKPNPAAMLQ